MKADKTTRRAVRQPFRALAAIAIAAAGVVSMLPAQAQTVPGGWYNVGLVTRVHPGDGSGFFYFSTATQLAISGCSQNTSGYAFDTTSAATSRNFAVLLTAYTSGKPVGIHLTGLCSGGSGAASRPLVDSVEMTDVGYW
jgi:hypothetical protein